MRRTTLLVGVVLALGLSACGSKSSDTGSAATTAPAATTTAAASSATTSSATTGAASGVVKATTIADAKAQMEADSGLSTVQSGCIVDKLVAAVGEKKALEIVNIEDDLATMDSADQKTAGDALLGCVSKEDFATLIADGLLGEMKDLGVTDVQAKCVGTKMIELVTPEGLLGLGRGVFDLENMDPAQQGKLFQIFVDCLPPDVLGKMAGAATDATATTAASSTATTKG